MQWVSAQHRYEGEEYATENEEYFEYRKVEFRNTEVTDGYHVKESTMVSKPLFKLIS